MITSIDLNYFFDGNPEHDLRSTEEYKKNLNKYIYGRNQKFNF